MPTSIDLSSLAEEEQRKNRFIKWDIKKGGESIPMYVHIRDTVSVPIESIITMVHQGRKNPIKSLFIPYKGLGVYRHGTRGTDQTYVVTDDCVYGSSVSIKDFNETGDEFMRIIKRWIYSVHVLYQISNRSVW